MENKIPLLKTKFVDFIKKYLVYVLIALLIGSFITTMLDASGRCPDSDTFFIIETGKYIVENKEVPKINPFVIHEDMGMIVQQWSFDVLIYLLYSSFGYTGVFAYVVVALLIAVLLVYKLLGLYTDNLHVKLFLTSVALWILSPFATVRPTPISFIVFLCVILILENYKRGERKWMAWLLPVLSFVLVNTHASMWPVMFVIMLPFICPNIIEFVQSPKKCMNSWFATWWDLTRIIIPIMALVGFFNPNSWRGMFYVLLSYGQANRMSIAELYPPSMLSTKGIYVIVVLIASLFYASKYKTKVNSAHMYMAMGTMLLAAMHSRNNWFLIFAAMPILADLFNVKCVNNVCIKKQLSKFAKCAIVFVLCASGIVTACTSSFYIKNSTTTPVLAANYLDQFTNKEDIVLYTEFNNGAYMEMRGYKVYMDARPELFSDAINGTKDVLGEYLEINTMGMQIEYILTEYKFTHLLVEVGSSTFFGYLLNDDRYDIVMSFGGYYLFEHVDFVGER